MRFILLSFLLFCGLGEIARGDASQWVRIKTGSYRPLFGGSSLIPVRSFAIMREPVSHADFREFLEHFPEWRKNKVKALFADTPYLQDWQPDEGTRLKGVLQKPVVYVSWFAAKAYCQSKGARLPSNDEWEYIAGQDNPEQRDALILEWYSNPSEGQNESESESKAQKDRASFVGRLGVKDMYGKIWEWTSDFNSSFGTGESREDSSQSKAMFCGAGSMGSSNPEEYATFMRYAFRSSLKAKYSLQNLGFRCARNEGSK